MEWPARRDSLVSDIQYRITNEWVDWLLLHTHTHTFCPFGSTQYGAPLFCSAPRLGLRFRFRPGLALDYIDLLVW